MRSDVTVFLFAIAGAENDKKSAFSAHIYLFQWVKKKGRSFFYNVHLSAGIFHQKYTGCFHKKSGFDI